MTRRSRAFSTLLTAAAFCFATVNVEAHHDRHPILQGAIYPQISAQGDTIAFAHQGAIWRIARQGGAMIRLTDQEGYDTWPTWSPDGKRIAYINGRRSHIGPIQLISASDGRVIRMPQRPIAKHRIQFSPDGKRLLGMFHKNGVFALRWFDLKTGNLGDARYKDQWGVRYALSGDGRRIALSTTQDVRGEQGGNNGPQCDVWIMPSDNGSPRKLLRFPGRVYEVAWAADGRTLYVVSNVGGAHNDLWRIPLDNPRNGARKLTFGQADEDAPSVDAAGKWLVYSDNRRGPTSLVVRDLATSHESRVGTSKRDFRTATGRLLLEVVDAATGQRATARVTIRDENGKFHAPPRALYRMLRGDLHFYCRGATSWELPAGKYRVKVARGPEYAVQRSKLVVPAGSQVRKQLKLKRWTHQRARRWYSGESHIHANYGYGEWYNSPRTMLAQAAGEDLIVSNFVVANSEADGVFDRQYFRGRPDPLSTPNNILYWNQEFRSTIWGHLTLLNLKQLVEPIFTGFAHTTNPHDHPTNADIADHVHDQNGHVNYTHPATNLKDPYLSAYSAKALPLDVALGKVDSIDVMGANQEANLVVWYRLLNCGFRIPAAAGTDCFLNRVRSRLPGQVRVYVHVEGDFSYQRWVKSLKAGRTFVTDGPMFEFKVNDKLAGSTIKLEAPGMIRIRGRVTSQYPLDRVEIVANGKVVRRLKLGASTLKVPFDEKVDVPQSGWVAVRAAGPPHPDQPTGSLFAHTGAVYLEVKDNPFNSAADAAYFVKWIDRLRTDIRKRNRVPSRHRVHVESQMARALEVFNRLASPGR